MSAKRHSYSRVRRTQRRGRGLRDRFAGLTWRAAFALPFVLIALSPISSLTAAAAAPTTWTGALAPSSPTAGLTDSTVVKDGARGLAQYHYAWNLCTGPYVPSGGCGGPGVATRTMNFFTTADDPGHIRVDWKWTGLHAYFNVRAGLSVVQVSAAGPDPAPVSLVDAGPQNCCTAPSGGFTYTGTTYFDVGHGDVYGFSMTGSNGDADSTMSGTLTVALSVVDNGSFELGTSGPVPTPAPSAGPVPSGGITSDNAAGYTRLAPGSSALQGWTIDPSAVIPAQNTAEVDWTGARWAASQGSRSLELTGGPSAGAIFEDLPTIPGQAYNLSFDYSANPDRLTDPTGTECVNPNDPAHFAVTFDGTQLTGSQIGYGIANSTASMQWQSATFPVTASTATTRIRFFATDFPNRGCGIVLDNVSVIPVINAPPPPPADTPQANDGSWTVNSAADHEDGICGNTDCTLREAISRSNAYLSEGANSISFAIPGSGAHTITVTTPLPSITSSVGIDGTTQAGSTCGSTPSLNVEVSGTGAGAGVSGLVLASNASTIRGLAVDGFSQNGIALDDASNNDVECMVIGTAAHSNGGAGVSIQGTSTGNRIGSNNDGTADDLEVNVITHNGAAGIAVGGLANANRLDGNSIDLNGGLGIDLGPAGPTPNDATDADTGPNGLQNTPIVIRTEAGANGGIAGRLTPPPGIAGQDVSLFVSPACDASGYGEGARRIGTAHVVNDAAGIGNFVISIAGLPVGQFVTATSTAIDGSTSEFSACVPIGAGNDSWPNAVDISTLGVAGDTLSYAGQTRWYKFAIAPGAQVTVNLGNLPADYDLLLFKDIQQAYTALNSTTDPTQLAALFSGTGQKFSGTGQKFSGTGQKFSEDVFSGTGQKFSGTGQKFSGDLSFAGDAFSGTGQKFSADAFSGTGQKFSDQGFAGTGQKFSPEAYSGAQSVSLIDFSAATGLTPEAIIANTWNNTGYFYVRVSGGNGVFDPTRAFTVTKNSGSNDCAGLVDYAEYPLPAPVGTGIRTVILTDPSRLPGTAAEKATLASQLALLEGASHPETAAKVIDVGAITRIQKLNTQATSRAACPYAKNLLAAALKQIVDSYRIPANPNLSYVVLVGGDSTIPFFRYADTASLAPESAFNPPVAPLTASEASLKLNYVLSQDAYGANVQLSQSAGTFPVPDLGVGRLVETASEASIVLDAYLNHTTSGVVATPTRSLATGYDFMADAATSVQADFSGGLVPGTGKVFDSLIAPNNILPTDSRSWNATQLRQSLMNSGRHDLVFLAGHFSSGLALAADFSTSIQASEIANSTTDFQNTIVFSQGCHSGYGVVDADGIPNVTDTLDWAQAFARKGATLVAGTGYQYGDTDLVQYSEAIYADFAHELRVGSGPVSVGQALIRAKQAYLRATPNLDGVDTKALLESTLFGLPMLSVNLPAAGRVPGLDFGTGVSPTAVGSGPGAGLGLSSLPLSVSTSGITQQPLKPLIGVDGASNTSATYYKGTIDGFVTAPSEPVLPLVTRNVTAAGTTLRGVGLRGGTYTDLAGITPLVTAPATEVRTAHTGFSSPVFYPIQIVTPNYFDALGGGQTRLLITPIQHRAENALGNTSTLRKFDNVDVKLFYSSNTSAAARSAPPSILDVVATPNGGAVDVSVHVAGDPAAGIQGVWVTSTFGANWSSVGGDLAQDPTDPSHWTGSVTIPVGRTAADVRFLVQAVNGVGVVALDANDGAFYTISSAVTAAPHLTTMALDSGNPPSGTFGGSVTIGATLGGAVPLLGQPVQVTLAGSTQTVLTNSAGHVSVTLPVAAVSGSAIVSASFVEDAVNTAATATHAFSISKAGTTLLLAGPAFANLGTPSGVTATLKDAAGNGLGQRTVIFVAVNTTTAATAQSKAVVTDYLGVASLGSVSLPVGNYTVRAYFNGTVTLLPSSTVLTLTDDAYQDATAGPKAFGIYWPFPGFLSPVDNLPTINTANAGSAIPVKFTLGGNRGMAIFASGYPKAVIDTCTAAATDDIEVFASATSSALQYDASSGQYTYVWKTDKASMAGKCVRLDLVLTDGSTHSAQFKLK